MRKSLLGAGNALYLVLGVVTQTRTGVTAPWDLLGVSGKTGKI